MLLSDIMYYTLYTWHEVHNTCSSLERRCTSILLMILGWTRFVINWLWKLCWDWSTGY